ncbi:MAG: hypothetical protein IJG50_01240 [Clostridia bacterium]|nr:hypothetical protein [Clostridia bacterium]
MDYDIRELNIEDIYKETFKPKKITLYKIIWDGVTYDFLINHVSGSKVMAAFGTGTMSNRALKLPFFARLSWYQSIPVTSVWYADPTLYEGKLKLYWYYGTNKKWYLENIAFLLSVISKNMGVDVAKSLFFGSSGGGYSSLVLATMLRGKAYVINPQIFLYNYNEIHYKRFVADRCPEGEKPKEERTNLLKLCERERYIPRTYCLQNIRDVRDIDKQITPFLSEIAHNAYDCGEAVTMDFYYDEKGHNGMPDKATTLEFIKKGLLDKRKGKELLLEKRSGNSLSFFERIYDLNLRSADAHITYANKTKPHEIMKGVNIEWQKDGSLLCTAETYTQSEDYLFAFNLISSKNRIYKKRAYSPEKSCRFEGIPDDTYTLNSFVKSGAITEMVKVVIPPKKTEV